MLKVNHLDNLDRLYPAKHFLGLKFIKYKIIYRAGNKIINIICSNKKELKREMLMLFRKYKYESNTVNVVGILGDKNAIRKKKKSLRKG